RDVHRPGAVSCQRFHGRAQTRLRRDAEPHSRKQFPDPRLADRHHRQAARQGPGPTLPVSGRSRRVADAPPSQSAADVGGAGAQEVRLRPGSYKLHAVKDGKPVTLDRDLVTITRGDKQIVRVRLEGESAASIMPKAERGVFVLLGGKGVDERRFDTLAEVV